ncbi:hypothetical protein ASD12_32375 [Mesorhizobium sp. Root102]|nr:hypothetical protein ASD12_32375 [Mesorhizobium sp. Root102]
MNERCERGNVVEQGEIGQVIGAAGVVLPTLAGPDQNSVPGGKTELANLDINAAVMQGYFTCNGYACLVGTQIVRSGWQVQLGGKLLQTRARG